MMCHLYFSRYKLFNYEYVHNVKPNVLHLNIFFLNYNNTRQFNGIRIIPGILMNVSISLTNFTKFLTIPDKFFSEKFLDSKLDFLTIPDEWEPCHGAATESHNKWTRNTSEYHIYLHKW